MKKLSFCAATLLLLTACNKDEHVAPPASVATEQAVVINVDTVVSGLEHPGPWRSCRKVKC